MLNDRLHIVSEPNIQDTSIVDMTRGVFVDSRALSTEQFTRYFRSHNTQFIQRPELNYRQAAEFYSTYLLGERLLKAKKDENAAQITRLTRYAGKSFILENIEDILGTSIALLAPGLVQRRDFGYVRSKLEVQKIADWAAGKRQLIRDLGLLPGYRSTNEAQDVERISNLLRDKYVAQKPQAAAAGEEE